MITTLPKRTRIKICCIGSREEAELAVRAGADAVGFVGVPSSPRAIDARTIAAIVGLLPPPIATFLLTSESMASRVVQVVRATGASTVQLVKHLAPPESEELAKLLPTTRRVQVIHVENRRALDLTDAYAPHVHAFLLDSGRPSLPTPQYGGTGKVHDWSVSAEFVRRSPRPVFLAGGLSPHNIVEAITRVRPFGMDLCSGVRTEGRLDCDKLSAFVQAVRAADALASNEGGRSLAEER